MNKTAQPHTPSPQNLPDHPAAAQLLAVVANHENGMTLESLRQELQQQAGLTPTETADLAEQMCRQDWLKRDDKHLLHLAGNTDLVAGRLYVSRAGNGFVEQKDGETLAFVPARQVNMALNGDTVLARVRRSGKKAGPGSDKLPEAAVVAVLERGRETLAGTVRNDHKGLCFEPADPGIQQRFRLSNRNKAPGPGTRVAVELASPAKPNTPPQATITKVIGPENDARTDTELILTEYTLSPDFPEAVRQEAQSAVIDEASLSQRRDLRDQHVITIDPESAKDFDDALSLRRLNRDVWEACVHIADVSHFVPADSALDREAQRRGCSVYLPSLVVPMLPEVLSNDLCSLKPGKDRLAFSAMLRLRENGELLSVKFAESVIRSRCRLTYEEAVAALDSPEAPSHERTAVDAETRKLLKQLNRFSSLLRERRLSSGALNMATDEVRLVLDDQGEVDQLRPVVYDQAHQLIEEFMLLANEAACLTLERAGLEQLHRNHPEPEAAKLVGIAQQLNQAGVAKSAGDSDATLQSLLERVSGRADQGAWTSVMLRALPKAEYSADAEGHYGLAKAFYAHFTSPIRRYPDVITHRLLKAMLSGAGQIVAKDDLQAIAGQCSEKERTAQRAERQMSDMKLLRFLRKQLESKTDPILDATVMKAHKAGTQIYIPEYRVVGWLPSSKAASGNLATGQPIQVIPATIDVTRGELEVRPAP